MILSPSASSDAILQTEQNSEDGSRFKINYVKKKSNFANATAG
jgi:hypothetical protein